jgi:hypothetical protein
MSAYITEKIATVPPIANERDRMAIEARPALLRIDRSA